VMKEETIMDLVLKLRELRRSKGLRQSDVARASGLGIKTISSFETGERIESMKISQLERILAVYGLTATEFFSGELDQRLRTWDTDDEERARTQILGEIRDLPHNVQRRLLSQFKTMVESATSHRFDHFPPTFESEWNMLNSRN